MKILKLRFKNLNSLLGEWQIDFTAEEFLYGGGLFAITGNTGSGKSTILDAICLALYGQTPRLGAITSNNNEIMSRQSGECYAEVVFETLKGSFICQWRQRRAYSKASGALQPPQHELSEYFSGKIKEDKTKGVIRAVEELSGLDFQRFTRSVLLPQGDFAAFLQAKVSERVEILEKLTGTFIYSQISEKTYQKNREIQEFLKEIEQKAANLPVLSKEEESAYQEEFERREKLNLYFKKCLNDFSKSIDWQKNLDTLKEEIKKLSVLKIKIKEEQILFEPSLKLLERGKKASDLAGLYTLSSTLLKQKDELLKRLLEIKEEKPEKEKKEEESLKDWQTFKDQFQEVKTEKQKEEIIIKNVRILDHDLTLQSKELEQNKIDLNNKNKAEDKFKKQIAELDLILEKIAVDKNKINEYKKQFPSEQELTTKLPYFEKQLFNYQEAQKEIELLKGKIGSNQENCFLAEKNVKEFQHQQEVKEARKKDLSEQLKFLNEEFEKQSANSSLNDLENELENYKIRQGKINKYLELLSKITFKSTKKKENEKLKNDYLSNLSLQEKELLLLNKNIEELKNRDDLAKKVKNFASEREKLIANEPCFLCGSLSHPWGLENPKIQSESENLKKETDLREIISEKIFNFKTGIKIIESQNSDIEEELKSIHPEFESIEQFLNEFYPKLRDLDLKCFFTREDEKIDLKTKDTSKIIKKLNKLNSEKLNIQKQQQEIAENIISKNLKKAELSLNTLLVEQKSYQKDLESWQEKILKEKNILIVDWQPYFVSLRVDEKIDADFKDLLKELTLRAEKWLGFSAEEKSLNEKQGTQAETKTVSQTKLNNLQEQIVELKKLTADLDKKYQNTSNERRELFGDKEPNQVEKDLIANLEKAEEKQISAQSLNNLYKEELIKLKEEEKTLNSGKIKLENEIKEAEEFLQKNIIKKGFLSKDDYLKSIIPEDKLLALENKAQQLTKESEEIISSFNKNLEEIRREKKKKLTTLSSQDLQKINEEKLIEISANEQEIGALRQILEDNKKFRKQKKEELEILEQSRKKALPWEMLNSLIGSSDGNKYRLFVQSLTLRELIKQANFQLKKLSGRYILQADQDDPLEFMVLDNYQFGEIRSAKNLSGGESFLLSLALALGLSQLASKNMRVDSLFLDEGFGVLDEETLDGALNVLALLPQEGKLIGIISHVASVKERFGTQIELIAKQGGVSLLKGAGCKAL